MQAADHHDKSSDYETLDKMGKGSSSTEDAHQWDQRVNPGEVEWDLADLQADAELEGKTNIRKLDFSAKLSEAGVGVTQVGSDEKADTSLIVVLAQKGFRHPRGAFVVFVICHSQSCHMTFW